MTTHNGIIAGAAPGAPGMTDDQAWSDPEAWRASGEGEWHAESRGAGLARALGFLSLGLGITQLVAPRALGRLTGVGDRPELMRGLGARELASGVGILANERPASWVWARVVGDVMDLALLSRALDRPNGDRKRVLGAAAAVAGALVLDAYCAQQLSREGAREAPEPRGIRVRRAITINRPAQELYAFWRDFTNLPSVMDHVESIEVLGDRRSHWKVKGPAGATVEWDAEITADRPGELIAWRSLEGADVNSFGSVRFIPADGGRGTVVRIDLRYDPPAGRIGAAVAKLFHRAPDQEIAGDLRPFKQLMETGEVATTEGQPAGRRSPIGRLVETLER